MSQLVERARRTVRNYPEHVAKREQAKLILDLADEIERLGKAFDVVEQLCESRKEWYTLVMVGNLRKGAVPMAETNEVKE